MRVGREGAARLPPLGQHRPPEHCGWQGVPLLPTRKTGPGPHPTPVPLSSNLPGSQLRQRLPRDKSLLPDSPALGPLSGFLVPSQGRWGPCLISEAEPSHPRGTLGNEASESGI